MVEQEKQKLLPRIGMIWFFVVATVIALALGIVRSAEQGQALSAALVLSAVFLSFFSFFSAACFLAAYFFGATERAFSGGERHVSSPFSRDALPDQVIPPNPSNEV